MAETRHIFKRTESGRSMVEMLGVLAIMGMLSVVVVIGIRLGLNKAKANQIIKDARLAHTSLLTDPISASTDWLDVGFTPISGHIFHKRVNEDQQILVRVTHVANNVCKEVLHFTNSRQVKFYDEDYHELETCAEPDQNIVILFDMAGIEGDPIEQEGCITAQDCENGWCNAGECVACPDYQQPNAEGTGCTAECDITTQDLCGIGEGQDKIEWCCAKELQCGSEPGTCSDGTCSWNYEQGDLTATCSWTFIETPAASECSATYTQDPRLASCTVSFGEVTNTHQTKSGYSSGGTNGSLSVTRMDQDCPAGSYCYVQFNDENCDSNVEDDSTGTLYGVCNPLDTAQNICTRKAHFNMDNDACPEGRYCVLTFTDDTCAGTIADDTVGTIYGVCSPLSSNEARCIKGAELKANENSACPEGQYCNLNFTDKSCGDSNAIQETSQGELWGTCVAYSSNEARCVRPFTMEPATYCPQEQWCYLNWKTNTGCTAIDDDYTGTIHGTCVAMNKASGVCPYNQ